MGERKKWIPTRRQLESAWKWKKRGKTTSEIAERIGTTLGKYQKALKYFRSYYLQKAKEEKNYTQKRKIFHKKNMAEIANENGRNYKAGERKLDIKDIDLDVLRSYVICGFNRDKIAGLMGITRNTLYNYGETFPEIKYVLDNAAKEATAGVMTSLLAMTKDRQIDDEAVVSYLGEANIVSIKKALPANFQAIRYWLTNNLGWGSEPKSERSNSKGLIVKMLDNIANHEDGVGPVDEE